MEKIHPNIINNIRRQELLKHENRSIRPATPEAVEEPTQDHTSLAEVAIRASGLRRILKNHSGEKRAE